MGNEKALRICLMMVALVGMTAGLCKAQTTVRVPTDQPTIQGAINAAMNGDTVLVAAGTYVENIDFLGKAITVTSEGGAEVTIIDGNQSGRVVTFASGEERTSVLSGFTVRNGAGGITIEAASPTIFNNVIINNQSCSGAGIYVYLGSPLLEKNHITFNARPGDSGCFGGGVHIFGSGSVEILNNVISNNDSSYGGGIFLNGAGTPTISGNFIGWNMASSQGGGLMISNQSDALVVQNLFVGNSAGEGGGLYWQPSSGHVVNNTIVDNIASMAGTGGSGIFSAVGFGTLTQPELINNLIIDTQGQIALYCHDSSPILRSNNVFSSLGAAYGGICTDQTGINGNISSDPLFSDSSIVDYHLQPGSPSIDAGDNTTSFLPTFDFEGDSRILDGNGDSLLVVDMGIDEVSSAGPVNGIPDIVDLEVIITDSADPSPEGVKSYTRK